MTASWRAVAFEFISCLCRMEYVVVQLRDGEEGWFPFKAQSELSIQPMSDTNFSNFPILFLRSGKGLRVERQVVQFARGTK